MSAATVVCVQTVRTDTRCNGLGTHNVVIFVFLLHLTIDVNPAFMPLSRGVGQTKPVEVPADNFFTPQQSKGAAILCAAPFLFLLCDS